MTAVGLRVKNGPSYGTFLTCFLYQGWLSYLGVETMVEYCMNLLGWKTILLRSCPREKFDARIAIVMSDVSITCVYAIRRYDSRKARPSWYISASIVRGVYCPVLEQNSSKYILIFTAVSIDRETRYKIPKWSLNFKKNKHWGDIAHHFFKHS